MAWVRVVEKTGHPYQQERDTAFPPTVVCALRINRETKDASLTLDFELTEHQAQSIIDDLNDALERVDDE